MKTIKTRQSIAPMTVYEAKKDNRLFYFGSRRSKDKLHINFHNNVKPLLDKYMILYEALTFGNDTDGLHDFIIPNIIIFDYQEVYAPCSLFHHYTHEVLHHALDNPGNHYLMLNPHTQRAMREVTKLEGITSDNIHYSIESLHNEFKKRGWIKIVDKPIEKVLTPEEQLYQSFKKRESEDG